MSAAEFQQYAGEHLTLRRRENDRSVLFNSSAAPYSICKSHKPQYIWNLQTGKNSKGKFFPLFEKGRISNELERFL